MKTNRRTMSALAAGALALGGCSAIDDFGKFTRGDATDAGSIDAGSIDAFMNAPDVFVPEGVDANLPDAFVPEGVDANLPDAFGVDAFVPETCNGLDDDGDGVVDDGATGLSARIDLGLANRGLAVAATSDGFVATWSSSTGFSGQRRPLGASAGPVVSLSGDPAMAVRVAGTTLYAVSLATVISGSSTSYAVSGSSFETADLSLITSTPILTTTLRVGLLDVAIDGANVLVGVGYLPTVGTTPSIMFLVRDTAWSGTTRTASTLAPTSRILDMDLSPDGFYVAAETAAGVGVEEVSPDGTSLRSSPIVAAGALYIHIAAGRAADGSSIVGALYRDASALRFALLNRQSSSTLVLRDSVVVATALPASLGALDLAFADDHFVATWLAPGSAGSTWQMADITAPASGAPVATVTPVESAETDNAAVSLAVHDSHVFLAASRSGAIARAYLRCN